jgi:hypothetical protein
VNIKRRNQKRKARYRLPYRYPGFISIRTWARRRNQAVANAIIAYLFGDDFWHAKAAHALAPIELGSYDHISFIHSDQAVDLRDGISMEELNRTVDIALRQGELV